MALFKKDKEFYERFFGGFLLSINYMHLAEALDLTDMRMDIQENLKDFFKKNDYDDEMQKRIIIETIYDYMLEKQHISKARINEDNLIKKLEEHYYYYLHFYDIGKWDEIKKQMIHEIKTKKVTSYYLLEKYFNQLIDYYFPGNNFAKADSNILLKSIEQIIENQSAQLDGYVYKYVVEDAIYGFKGDSLNFDDLSDDIKQTIDDVERLPIINLEDITEDIGNSYLIVNNFDRASYFNDIFSFEYSENLLLKPFYNYECKEYLFLVLTTFESNETMNVRSDFSKNYVLKGNLIHDSPALAISPYYDIFDELRNYSDKVFIFDGFQTKSSQTFEDMKICEVVDEDDTEFILISSIENEGVKIKNPLYETDHSNHVDFENEKINTILNLKFLENKNKLANQLFDICTDLKIDFEYINSSNNYINSKNDLIYHIHRFMLINRNYPSLDDMLEELRIKTILIGKEEFWNEIKEDLIEKTGPKLFDILRHYGDNKHTCSGNKMMKTNILYELIKEACRFKEISSDYIEKLAYQLQNQDPFENDLHEYLDDLVYPKITYEQKDYLDEGKYPAPFWFIYPYSKYGLDKISKSYNYNLMREESEDFKKLFGEPLNYGESNLFRLVAYWNEDGSPKYDKFTEDSIIIDDFSLDSDDFEIRVDNHYLLSIRELIDMGKILLEKYNENVREDNEFYAMFEDESERKTKNEKSWDEAKYSICLNALYFYFMENEDMKNKLLQTGTKCLIYKSDDEFGGKDNLLGFALMELRDEIRRLYENENLVDWQYSEYLKYNVSPKYPKNLQEAIGFLIENSSKEFVDAVHNSKKGDLSIGLHFSLGMWIRNEFGINNHHNTPLLNDLEDIKPFITFMPDSASGLILDKLWEYVHENYDEIIEETKFTNEIDMHKYLLN